MELATARNLFAADTGGGHYPTKPRTLRRQQHMNEMRQRYFDAVPYGPEDLH